MNFIKRIFRLFFDNLDDKIKEKQPALYSKEEKPIEEVHSIWDYIKFIEQSQAHHICSVIGFEEWVSMEEILRRVKEIFRIEYKNERSLYPYIKTLVDCGLVENTAVGGKMKWRKKEALIKIKTPVEEKEKTKEKPPTIKAT